MFMFNASHTLLIAVPSLAAAGILAGLGHHVHAAAELEKELDNDLQDKLCELAAEPNWAFRTDEEAWEVVESLGGRKHLLEQARLMLSLTIERAKEGDETAAAMEEQFCRLAVLLKRSWRFWLMPQTHAHLCVDIFTDMCGLWETQTWTNNGHL